MNIIRGKRQRAVKTVIYGTEGIGKSTLAAAFPNPLFVDCEGGTDQLDIARVVPLNWNELVHTVMEIAYTNVCETIVIDTADAAEAMCITAVCEENKQKTIESFGYGKGYTVLANRWREIMAALDKCIERGVNVVVIAHAKRVKVEEPDQTGSYDHFEMKLTKLVAPLVKEWADMLLFMNYSISVTQDEKGSVKAKGGRRVVYTQHNPCWDAKNRFGLANSIEPDFAYLAHIFPHNETCTDCGVVILPEQGRTAEQIIEGSRKTFGRQLCLRCSIKANAERVSNPTG